MAYQVTGNEFLSLPTIRESDGAVEGITFLYMQVKGLLELRGNAWKESNILTENPCFTVWVILFSDRILTDPQL